MTQGRHACLRKSKDDPTFSDQWSGVSFAPEAEGLSCARCGGHVHAEGEEGDCFYCPCCDDYVKTIG